MQQVTFQETTDKTFDHLILSTPEQKMVAFISSTCSACIGIRETLQKVQLQCPPGAFDIFIHQTDQYPGNMFYYGVSQLPTLIFFKEGDEFFRYTGHPVSIDYFFTELRKAQVI